MEEESGWINLLTTNKGMHASNGNSKRRADAPLETDRPEKKLKSDVVELEVDVEEDDNNNNNNNNNKPRRKAKNRAISIQEALVKYSDQELYTVWRNLRDKKISEHDTTGPIKWNHQLYKARDSEGIKRYCWGVNKVAYGCRLRDSDRLRIGDLALVKSLYKMGEPEKQNYRAKLMLIGKGKKKTDLLSAHICGRGRSEGKGTDKAGKYCVNPYHIMPKTYRENAEHDHCHYFLHKGEEQRKRFYKAKLCEHDPLCF